jgi:DNA modification methylase
MIKPYFKTELGELYQGDCIEVMRTFPDNHFDTVITDPPYGLSFMGKKWDYDVPSVELWTEVLRVTKPGGTMLCFAGSRTQHRMAVNIEDSGWILKDCIMWIYGSGFPKATDISKQIDKIGKRIDMFKPFANHFKEKRKIKNLSHKDIAKHFPSKTGGLTGCVWNWENAENIPTLKQWEILKPLLDLSDNFLPLIERIETEREVVGKHPNPAGSKGNTFPLKQECDITIPTTPEAKLWNGWKSHGLKPAYEPILVCMKPNEGSYAENALKHGVAGLNIDGGRIGYKSESDFENAKGGDSGSADGQIRFYNNPMKQSEKITTKGRYPANIILDEESAKVLDGVSGNLQSGFMGSVLTKKQNEIYGKFNQANINQTIGDSGGASRFFYIAKASPSERNEGLDDCPDHEPVTGKNMSSSDKGTISNSINPVKNFHPTVKPIDLLIYLAKLTMTPTGGLVLDPFAGSGTTGLACENVEIRRPYILIEREIDYCEISKERIRAEVQQGKLFDSDNFKEK